MNENKNSTLGILALIFSVLGCTFLIGIILAIIDLTKKDGRKKTLSIIALVISGIRLLVGIIGAAKKKDNPVEQTVTTEATEISADLTTEDAQPAETETAETSDNDTSEAESSSAESQDYYFKDNEAVLKDYTIKITSYKVIQVGETGNEYGRNPVIAFWYDTTNTSGNEIDPTSAWIYIMEAVQDNNPNAVNKLEMQ